MVVEEAWVVVRRKSKKYNRRRRNRGASKLYDVSAEDEEVDLASVTSQVEKARDELRKSVFYQEFVAKLRLVFKEKTFATVGYGIGSVVSSKNSRCQLALALLIQELEICESLDLYDPVYSEVDKNVIRHFGANPMEKNEVGQRIVSTPTLFFMPHCGMQLYHNVLYSNWGAELVNVYVCGNSFKAYDDRMFQTEERNRSLVIQVLPFVEEHSIAPNAADSTDKDIHVYETAFSDTSLHEFPHEIIQSNLPALEKIGRHKWENDQETIE